MPFGSRKPTSKMLGTGEAAKAGSAIELRKQIEAIELRMTEPGYVPTEEEESRLKQLRGALQSLGRK